MLIHSTPIFAARDIVQTVDFYKSVLGFETSWTYGEPPTFGGVAWGNVAIMFNQMPELAANVGGHQHWVKVDEVDALYQLHLERGVKIVEPLGDRPWGAREYIAQDLNGYHLRFAGSPTGEGVHSKPFPEGVQVIARMPSEEEYRLVAGSTFYRDGVRPGVLESSWGGVVALGPSGEAIGTVRIMLDAPGWFSIWDVAVLPDWQGQRIGEAMMNSALEQIHAASPGANVYLFTFKHGFYKHLGFAEETVSMRKV